MKKLLVIIPAYNEEAAILNTIADLKQNCPQADYVVVNDCSRDRTREELRANGANYLDLPVNLGIGGGVQTGYKYAVEHGYDITVQFDGDGQHRADYIARLIAPIERGEADMAIGSRFVPHGDGEDKGFQSSAARRMGIRWISGLIRIGTDDTGCDERLSRLRPGADGVLCAELRAGLSGARSDCDGAGAGDARV